MKICRLLLFFACVEEFIGSLGWINSILKYSTNCINYMIKKQ
jgi:hypothetical protein